MMFKLAVATSAFVAALAQECTVDNGCRTPVTSERAFKMKDHMWKDSVALHDAIAKNGGLPQDLPTGPAPCVDGKAADYFDCNNVDLLSRTTREAMGAQERWGRFRAADIWGWVDTTTDKEYVLATFIDSTAVVDVTDPENPLPMFNIPSVQFSNFSVWRDVKVFQNTAYIVADDYPADRYPGAMEAHGIQVFDLERVRTWNEADGLQFVEPDFVYDDFVTAHNIFINEDTGFGYVVGGDVCAGGLYIIDLNTDRLKPTFVGCYASDGYTHDLQCVVYDGPDTRYTGREICFNYNEDTVTIVDVTNKTIANDNTAEISAELLSKVVYDGFVERPGGYVHQGWLTKDSKYVLMDDELNEYQKYLETQTFVFDVTDLEDPKYVGASASTQTTIDHNLYVKDDFTFNSNYQSGLRIYHLGRLYDDDASAQLAEIAYFDTDMVTEHFGSFGAGVWSSYIFFPSGNIASNDILFGLYMLKFNDPGPDGYTLHPTTAPTLPTANPTFAPTSAPTSAPTPPTANPTSAPTGSPTAAPSVASAEPEASSSAPVIGVAAALGALIIGSMVYYFKVVEPREKAAQVDAVTNKIDL